MPQENLAVATLAIYGDDLDPRSVTELIGLAPSAQHRRGDKFTSSSGNQRIARTGAWILHSDDFQTGEDLNEHIKAILNVIDRAKGAILSVAGVQYATVVLAVSCRAQPEVAKLSTTTLEKLWSQGLHLTIEVYPENDPVE